MFVSKKAREGIIERRNQKKKAEADSKPGQNFKNVRVSFGGKDDETVPVKIVTNKGTVDTAATKQLAKNNAALTGALMARERGITRGISWLVSQIAGDSKALGNPKRTYEIAKKIAPETIAEEKRRKALQEKQKGGRVVKKTLTVKRSSNGKAKQPVKKTARKTKKTTGRSKR